MWRIILLGLVLVSNSALAQSVAGGVNPPFMRSGDANAIPVTAVPTEMHIYQPVGTTSYRIVNPCAIDIAIRTVANDNTLVTPATGTYVLARFVETLASTKNPLGNDSTDRIISIMGISPTTHQPANDPGGQCVIYLGYGNGG